MKRFSLRNAFACLKTLSLITVAAVGLTSCGGGGGGSDENIVAPESLDKVNINFFGAFRMNCVRLNGTAGNETGAAEFFRLNETFFLGISSGSGTIGRNVQLPAVLTHVAYTYQRTGTDTGRVTFTWVNNQAPPWTLGTAALIDRAYMFWNSGTAPGETTLVVDFLFQNSGTNIGGNTARVRNAYYYEVGPIATAIPFDAADTAGASTKTVNFTMSAGGAVRAGYNPYSTYSDQTPSTAVWPKLHGRTVTFAGGTINQTIAFRSSNIIGPDISGQSTSEDRGTILIDSPSEGVSGASGTYSYIRTGGSVSKLAVRYQKTVASVTSTVTLQYTMDFDSLDGGSMTESTTSSSGTFDQSLFNPNP